MAIKTILGLFSGEANERGALHTAFGLARELSGALRVLHIAEPPIFYDAITNYGETPPQGAEKIEVLEKAATNLALAAQAYTFEAAEHHDFSLHFEGSPELAAFQAQFRTAIGTPETCLIQEGRSVDLIVTAYDNALLGDLQTLLAALFKTGRPVLAIPRNPGRNFSAGHFPATVMVAWDGSLAAARAVRDAIPLMQQASSVYLVCAAEGGQTPGATGEQDMMAYLHSHSVSLEILHLPSEGSVGAGLLTQAGRLGADLLVMGAYGTNHVGEMLLGGASNHVIKHTNIPLLLSH